MKKVFVLCLILTLLLPFSSCKATSNITNGDALSRIHVIETADLSLDNTNKNEKSNVISADRVCSYNENADKEIKISLLSKDYNVKYKETAFYPTSSKILDGYTFFNDAGEEVLIQINQEGKICSIRQNSFAVLNINNTDSKETVRKALETSITGIIDYSKYDHVKIIQSVPDTETFGLYTFTYYNMVDGHLADFARLFVNEDGEVGGLSIWDVGTDVTDLKINKDLETQAIELKLKDMCASDGLEFESFEHSGIDSIIRLYEGELYIEYPVSLQVKGQQYSELVYLLIPVDLISQ